MEPVDLGGMFLEGAAKAAAGLWGMLLQNPWLLVMLIALVALGLLNQLRPHRRRRH